MVHFANNVRPNLDGLKVGGHQASSASVATIMTSLYFDFMRSGDRISVKPHASPVYHAIQYLLGNLDKEYLETLRAFHGLQAYPSRTKDPDEVDYSTGSVGLGAVAPNFAALVGEYTSSHFHEVPGGPDGLDRRVQRGRPGLRGFHIERGAAGTGHRVFKKGPSGLTCHIRVGEG